MYCNVMQYNIHLYRLLLQNVILKIIMQMNNMQIDCFSLDGTFVQSTHQELSFVSFDVLFIFVGQTIDKYSFGRVSR